MGSNRLMSLAALALLAACGGGVSQGGVVDVRYGPLPPGLGGYTSWDSGGTTITLLDTMGPFGSMQVLEHEIWHALTLRGEHPDEPGCVCAGYFPDAPCDYDIESVIDANPITLDFPDDTPLLSLPAGGEATVAEAAAAFWNDAVGRELVRVK